MKTHEALKGYKSQPILGKILIILENINGLCKASGKANFHSASSFDREAYTKNKRSEGKGTMPFNPLLQKLPANLQGNKDGSHLEELLGKTSKTLLPRDT